jgi:toxin CcdB
MALVARTGRVPADSALHPYFDILGQHVYADPFDLASIATVRLGTAVARLAEADCYRVARLIDEMISQA